MQNDECRITPAVMPPALHSAFSTHHSAFASPPVAADGSIARDLSCRRCGYNLRTLRADANCPECAMPVAASVHGDDLLYSDPAWLSKITLGSDLMVAGWLAVLPAVLCVFLFIAAFAVLSTAVVAAILTGTWLLTRPDPSGAGEPSYGRTRKLARVLPFASLAAPFLSDLHDTLAAGPTPPTLTLSLLTAGVYASQSAGLAALLALLSYLQSLAATRMNEPDLAKRCVGISAQLFGGFVACLALDVAGRFITHPSWQTGHLTVSALAGLYLLVALVRHVGVLIHVRGLLHRHLTLAREAWPGPPEGPGTTRAP
jgi:hypothetical protein